LKIQYGGPEAKPPAAEGHGALGAKHPVTRVWTLKAKPQLLKKLNFAILRSNIAVFVYFFFDF